MKKSSMLPGTQKCMWTYGLGTGWGSKGVCELGTSRITPKGRERSCHQCNQQCITCTSAIELGPDAWVLPFLSICLLGHQSSWVLGQGKRLGSISQQLYCKHGILLWISPHGWEKKVEIMKICPRKENWQWTPAKVKSPDLKRWRQEDQKLMAIF